MKAGRASARSFVLLLGVVSLLGDMTYEGGWSIVGPYMATLGASAAVVGIASGFGELVGYAVRLLSGVTVDRTRGYWPIAFFGYVVNMLAVPALALAGSWPVATALVIAERFGKGVRVPPRDAMLASAASRLGAGWAFGVHEAMDQTGALLGPLAVALVLFIGGTYQVAFAVLAVPAFASLAVLSIARRRFPHPERTGEEQRGAVTDRRGFILYTIFASLTVAGFAHFSLISYHITVQRLLSEPLVPLFFAIATGVSAIAALLAGLAFDRVGLASVLFVPVVTAITPFLVFASSPLALGAGLVLWGIVLGAQESTVRAAVAHLVAPGSRATAYGIFNTAYGVAWFIGSAALGVAYDRSIPAVIAISVGTQVLALAAAIPVFASRRPVTRH
ncbi:MAG TPA: MFS transporter [Candidatus Saccharimonadales bacterium]|nr:MFS transporter [Candidatus Saccharimonadales bacterium]